MPANQSVTSITSMEGTQNNEQLADLEHSIRSAFSNISYGLVQAESALEDKKSLDDTLNGLDTAEKRNFLNTQILNPKTYLNIACANSLLQIGEQVSDIGKSVANYNRAENIQDRRPIHHLASEAFGDILGYVAENSESGSDYMSNVQSILEYTAREQPDCINRNLLQRAIRDEDINLMFACFGNTLRLVRNRIAHPSNKPKSNFLWEFSDATSVVLTDLISEIVDEEEGNILEDYMYHKYNQ